jgi:hypothetical protein
MHTASVNNLIVNNYWNGNQIDINDYGTYRADQSPLTDPISTEFDQTFTLPSYVKAASTNLLGITWIWEPLLIVAVIVGLVIAVTLVVLVYCNRRKSR